MTITKKIYLGLLITFLLSPAHFLSGCSPTEPEGREFTKSLNKWASLVNLAYKNQTMNHTKTPTGGTIEVFLPNIEASIKENEDEWLDTRKTFLRISGDTSTSRWTDDALVCNAFLSIITHRLPINSLNNKGIESCWLLLNSSGLIALETQTRNFVARNLYLDQDQSNMSDQWLRAYFRRALISLASGEGSEKASQWLEKLRETGVPEKEYAELLSISGLTQ
jgi:hypothetical protein